MHAVPVIFAMRHTSKEFLTVAALVVFDFVVLSVFVLLQITGFFTFIRAFDPIFNAIANIVVNFEMHVVHMLL